MRRRFEHVNTELAFIDNLAACDGLTARRTHSTSDSPVATDQEFWPLVGRLRAFRGIDTLSALIIVLEVADFHRFAARGRSSARGSGWCPPPAVRRVRTPTGPITKTGSRYARRILVEAAWHYSRTPRIGAALAARHQGLPDHVLQIAWRAQHRLHRVHRRMQAHKKPMNIANVACARELSCFLWAAATAP